MGEATAIGQPPLVGAQRHTVLAGDSRRKTLAMVAIAVTGATLGGVLLTAVTTDLGARAVPGVRSGSFADAPLFGFPYWARFFEIATVVLFGVTLTILLTNCIQRRRVTTGTIFFAAAMVLYVLDPIGNWAPYAVYDPQMVHFPVSWPWAAIAPNIEPLVGVFGYFGFYVGIPVLCVKVVQDWLIPRLPVDSFVVRHPLVTLVAHTVVLGFILDATIEILMIHTGVLSYLQVVPFGSVWEGTRYQFPLLWQSLATTLPFIAVALLWWRDDNGRSNAELLAQRWRPLNKMGRLGTFVLVSVAMLLGYLAFVTPYAVIHKAGWATATAQPYLFCGTAVPDPNGLMKLNRQPGPYIAGWWPGPYQHAATRHRPPPPNACPSTDMTTHDPHQLTTMYEER